MQTKQYYTPTSLIKNGQNLEHWQHQILAQTWNKNSLILLVGLQNDTAMLEDTLDVFLKTKHS